MMSFFICMAPDHNHLKALQINEREREQDQFRLVVIMTILEVILRDVMLILIIIIISSSL